MALIIGKNLKKNSRKLEPGAKASRQNRFPNFPYRLGVCVPTDVEGGGDTVNLRQLLCEHDSLLLGLHKPGKASPKIGVSADPYLKFPNMTLTLLFR